MMMIYGSIILGLVICYVIRSPNRQPQKPELDPYEIAYLSGSKRRAVDFAITQLVYRGYLRPNVHNRTFGIIKNLPAQAIDLEQQVMLKVQRVPSFNVLRSTRQYNIRCLREGLEHKNILVPSWITLLSKRFQLFTGVILLGGLCMVLITSILASQLASATTALILYQWLIFFFICCLTPGRRTHWGSRVLGDIKKNHNAYDPMQRFALYGYKTLSGGTLDDLKQIFKEQKEIDDAAAGCGC